MSRGHAFLTLAVVAVVLGAALAIGLPREAEPVFRDLATTPAAELEAPGSIELVAGRTAMLERPTYMRIVGTKASMASVLAYYEENMARLGFVDGAGMFGIMTSTEMWACAWHGEGLVLRVSLIDLDQAAAMYPEVAVAGESVSTIYRVMVIEKRRDMAATRCTPPPSRS